MGVNVLVSQSFYFTIGEENAGLRLDEFLWSRFGGLSRMRIAGLITGNACRVNDGETQAGYRVAIGDRVEFTLDEELPTAMNPESLPLEIVYEDSFVVVVIKPSGMVVHPTKTVRRGTLANALAYYLNRDFYDSKEGHTEMSPPAHGETHSLVRPGIIHRLDRATSGLMVVAKTNRALSILSRHFHKRLVEKRYLGLIRGNFPEEQGNICAPIGRDPDRRPQWWVTESGKPAETRYRVLERFERAALVEMEPVTGRTNQLRIHCAYMGHPIFGEDLYANGWEDESLSPPARLCLHASRLAFHHPASGEWLEFDSMLPDAIAAFIDEIRIT